MLTVIWVYVALACIPLAGVVARRRGRRPGRWAVAAAFIGPVALLILAVLPSREKLSVRASSVVP